MSALLHCDDLVDTIDALAAGEPVGPLVSAGHAAHVAGCSVCQLRLAEARRLDAMLARVVQVAPPDGFSQRLANRIRDERWRRERLVDLAFNAVVSAVGLALLAAVWVVLQFTGMTGLLGNVASLAGQGLSVAASQTTVDSILYVAGTFAAITAFLMWRWSEGEHFL